MASHLERLAQDPSLVSRTLWGMESTILQTDDPELRKIFETSLTHDQKHRFYTLKQKYEASVRQVKQLKAQGRIPGTRHYNNAIGHRILKAVFLTSSRYRILMQYTLLLLIAAFLNVTDNPRLIGNMMLATMGMVVTGRAIAHMFTHLVQGVVDEDIHEIEKRIEAGILDAKNIDRIKMYEPSSSGQFDARDARVGRIIEKLQAAGILPHE